MSFTTHTNSQVAILEIDGRFDAQIAPAVAEWLENVVAKPGRVVVNLSNVYFLDSAALAVLVAAVKRARRQGGDLRLCGVLPSVQSLFDLTGLDLSFDTFESEGAAVRSF